MKKSIIIHEDTSALFETLGDAEAGQLLKAMLAYQNGKPFELDGTLGAIFAMLKIGLDKDNAAYEKKCEKNRENIRKRWNTDEPEEIPDDTNVYERIPNDTQEEEDIQEDLQVSKIPSKKRAREPRHRHGKYGHVKLTETEYNRLISDYGEAETQRAISRVDNYCQEFGKSYSDYNLTLRRWGFKDDEADKPQAPPGKTRQTFTPFIERTDNNLDALQRELARQQRQAARSG